MFNAYHLGNRVEDSVNYDVIGVHNEFPCAGHSPCTSQHGMAIQLLSLVEQHIAKLDSSGRIIFGNKGGNVFAVCDGSRLPAWQSYSPLLLASLTKAALSISHSATTSS